METVAVYAEHPIKTYGVKAQPEFSLLDLICPVADLDGCLAKLNPGSGLGQAFLVSSRRQGDAWRLCALMHQDGVDELSGYLDSAGLKMASSLRPAALIHLQGPHFGDRYGIFAAALSGLKRAKVAPLLMEACVHSLVIAVEPRDAKDAVNGLCRYFCAPE